MTAFRCPHFGAGSCQLSNVVTDKIVNSHHTTAAVIKLLASDTSLKSIPALAWLGNHRDVPQFFSSAILSCSITAPPSRSNFLSPNVTPICFTTSQPGSKAKAQSPKFRYTPPTSAKIETLFNPYYGRLLSIGMRGEL